MGEIDPMPAGDAVAHLRTANRVGRSSMPATRGCAVVPGAPGARRLWPHGNLRRSRSGAQQMSLRSMSRVDHTLKPCKMLTDAL
jgi:hypothetical protein